MYNLSKRQRHFGVPGKKLLPRCSYEAHLSTHAGLLNCKARRKEVAIEIAAYADDPKELRKQNLDWPLKRYSLRIQSQVLRAANHNSESKISALTSHPRDILRKAVNDFIGYGQAQEASQHDYY